MRTRVFRILAGLLAILIVWSLTMAERPDRSLRELVGTWVVVVVFALFAVFGAKPADWLIGLWFGGPGSSPVSPQKAEIGKQRSNEQPSANDERHAASPDQLP